MQDERMTRDAVGLEMDLEALAPLSFAQERLWFLDQMEHDPVTYVMPVMLALRGPLDVEALERGLSEVVARHEALRMRFVTLNGAPVQEAVPPGEVRLEVVDAVLWGNEELEQATTAFARERFDLASGVLLRARLLRRGDEDHVLVLVVHHIAADGWSVRVLFDELSALYSAFLAEGESPLPELGVQYADFAVWQREWLAGPVLDEQLESWRERLDGAATVLELPTDRPRPAVRSGSGALARFALDPDLVDGLQRLARKRRATLFMALLAGFSAVLSRWSGRQDLIVGTTVANRPRSELEGLIGFFVNTLPLRIDLTNEPVFVDLLDRVRDVSLHALAHQDVPFERLVEEFAPERSLSHMPLVQVVLVLQNAAGGSTLDLPGLEVSPLEVDAGAAKFELTVSLEQTRQGGLLGTVEYDRDLYDAATIERLTGHLQTLLAAAVADPGALVSRLPVLAEPERAWLLEQAGTPVAALQEPGDEVRYENVHELVAAQARATPDATALVADGQEFSHAELHTRTLVLARHLRERGAAPGKIVGVCLPRGADMVVAILAVLQTGAAYLPIDPQYPPARIALVTEDADAALVVTHASLRDRVPVGPVIVELDQLTLVNSPDVENLPRVSSDALMYVIHTSGSTGSPKGVAVPHRAVLALLTALDPVLRPKGSCEQEAWVAATSISFDLSVVELFWTLSRGVTLVVADTAALRGTGTEDIVALLARRNVRYFQSTPSLLRLLLAADGDDVLGHIATLVLGGEVIERSLFDRVSADGSRRVINGYGPTEATVYALLHVMTEPFASAQAPLGRPPAGTRAYVLGPGGDDLQPVGVPGELAIAGAQLADGYLGRPTATAERFVPDPFDCEPGSRMYLTGDQGVRDADGLIHFLGRDDEQVKYRGFRIELAEIEEVLRRHDTVSDAAVALVAPAGAEPRLAAFVTPAAPGQVGGDAGDRVGELRAHLVFELPWFMVPATVTFVPKLPLTSSGKLDRSALPLSAAARPDIGAGYRAPASELERTIGRVWASVLGIDRVGASDSFFDLGGNSMLLVQVREALGAALPRPVSLIELFRHPTVEALARHLAGHDTVGALESEAEERAQMRHRAGRRRAANAPRGGDGATRSGDAS